jgi:hypothetical protein
MFKLRGTVGDKNLLLLWCENKKRRKVSVWKRKEKWTISCRDKKRENVFDH